MADLPVLALQRHTHSVLLYLYAPLTADKSLPITHCSYNVNPTLTLPFPGNVFNPGPSQDILSLLQIHRLIVCWLDKTSSLFKNISWRSHDWPRHPFIFHKERTNQYVLSFQNMSFQEVKPGQVSLDKLQTKLPSSSNTHPVKKFANTLRKSGCVKTSAYCTQKEMIFQNILSFQNTYLDKWGPAKTCFYQTHPLTECRLSQKKK